MRYGYECEDCGTSVFPATPRSELQWLKERQHVAREVNKHSGGGLDSWMMEGLLFLDEHREHAVKLVSRR